ncbi:MAG: DDE-type integrase/transposase/recombinase, partial [Gaiellaceae bacterium]
SQGLLQPLPIPTRPWKELSMDFITHLPLSGEYDCIFVVVDRLSRMAHFVPTKSTMSAQEFGRVFLQEVVRLHGQPHGIVSDRDTRFTSEFWRGYMAMTRTTPMMSTAFHPQTDGLTERVNRTLKMLLRLHVTHEQSQWHTHLAFLEFAYNNSVQRATKYSPFYMNYGFNPTAPLALSSLRGHGTARQYLREIERATRRAQKHIGDAQRYMKHYADRKRRDVVFAVGDLVLLTTRHMRGQIIVDPFRKFRPHWVGPIRIVERIGPVDYRLQLPQPLKRMHDVFHVSQLKRFHITGDELKRQLRMKGALMEQRLQTRVINGKTEHLVRWHGMDTDTDTWVPDTSFWLLRFMSF